MSSIIVNGYLLDEEQLKPILENTKYQLIIAGAGCGKTLTLIGKIKYLLDNHFYTPEEICCISFTNEACHHLRQNILKNCQVDVPVFTFHKLALHILKIYNMEFQIASPHLLDEVINSFFENKCFGNESLQKIIYQKFAFFSLHNEKSWQKILHSKDFQNFKKLIHTFLCLWNCNHEENHEFKELFKNKKYSKILLIIYALFLYYESEKLVNQWIDFDDMLSYATDALKTHGSLLSYKMIIVDEFQDTSYIRFQLIHEIVKQNHSSLCVVGDDYQSIYHFSGCDISLFLHFQNFFPDARIYKISKTYRNSKELIETSGAFIQKNPYQIKKTLTSPKHLIKPIIFVYTKDKNKVLEKVISRIPKEQEILILGRNHFDLDFYTRTFRYHVKKNQYLEFVGMADRKIRFLTIHASKGLESDVVILLNVEYSLYGIPVKMKDEKILSLVKKKFSFPYEEERRLFYVALTRTKSYVYLIIPQSNPSSFIKELDKRHVKKIKL